MPQKTVLVTGGAGFIGSNFVRWLLTREPGLRIVNLDALTYSGNLGNLEGVLDSERHIFVHGSICDAALVASLLERYQPSGILNFAAESHVDRSIESPQVFLETNVVGTSVLLQAARQRGHVRFLQVSTDEVYGELGAEGLFSEASPVSPNSPYSASKAAADHLVQAYHRTFGLDTVTTRCSNNYGPYQFPEKMIPLMICNALADKPLPVYGDGLNVRDWIHVEDHCRAVWMAFQQGETGHVYNIGADSEQTNLAVVHAILAILDKPHSLIRFVKDRPGHDRRYAIDATRIRTELGWTANVAFAEGLTQTVDWYRSNRTWLDQVHSGEYMAYYARMYEGR